MTPELLQDVRYGVRGLAKRPGFTAVALIALALGIGANTAVFSVVNGVLLNPLPYPNAGRIVSIWPADSRTGESAPGGISPPDFADYRKQNTAFEHLSAYLQVDLTLTGGGPAERVPAAIVSSGFFETLGVLPAIGRTILAEDEQTGWPQIAILSDALWKRRFGGDPSIIGKTIVIDGKSTKLAGVMPAGFEFPKDAQLWSPMPFGYAELQVRRFHFIRVIGCLKRSSTIQQADAQMKSICARLAKIYPDSNAYSSARVVSLLDQTAGNLRPTMMLLTAAVAFVLLMACANVAHLLLARAVERRREIAIRRSVGATAGRLVRQLLTESVVLALLGGALGVLLAFCGLKALVALHPANLPRIDEVHLDTRVLAFTGAVSVITGILFGLLPALGALRTSSRPEARVHQRVHDVLVAVEIAVAVMLLAGASLMLRGFERLANVNPGFNPAGVLAVRIALPMDAGGGVTDWTRELGFYGPLLEKLKSLPGVEYAGLTSVLPLSPPTSGRFTIEGRPAPGPGDRPQADFANVSADYFTLMSIPLIQGRTFSESDDLKSPRVAIVSRSLAARYFPGQNPIGQHLNVDPGMPFRSEIVGVAGDVLQRSLGASAAPTIYVPYTQSPGLRAYVLLRTRGNVFAMVRAVKKQVEALNRDVPVFGVHSMRELVSDSLGQPRFRTSLLAVFAALAVLLAIAGVYGVLSHMVTQRTHEIGIRIAIGAGQRELTMLVAGRAMLWVAGGMLLGLAAALLQSKLIASMLYGIHPSDPISYLSVCGILMAAAFLASYVPARRATRVDAMVALRSE